MRFVIYGAGAIGGLIGGCLHQAGHQVELIARGPHLAAIQASGLELVRGDEPAVTLPIRAVEGPDRLSWDEPAVVLLTVKSQDTEGALEALEAVAPSETPIVCAQNGVANERRAARRFANTYGLCVMCPASHLEPGVVHGHSTPVSGLLDLGRYPAGVDDTARTVAGALRGATFESEALTGVMRWKYRKLLTNLSNAVEAICGAVGRGSQIDRLAVEEGGRVLRAAGIAVATVEEDAARRGDILKLPRLGSSTWGGGS
ncbi:MAG TPA: 2-dehydropantoate 2-reductase N-terminal domain-containing protein, partial [Acidimicrobiales bacterium]|nr:2-dehydropantoate 2-reductase N-terminal domain-containing protein [Acidimicrobiales bacterium]